MIGTLRQFDQVAGRAAAHLQRGRAGRRDDPFEHPVAAEQVIPSRQVVDMPRETIHPVHRRRVVDAGWTAVVG